MKYGGNVSDYFSRVVSMVNIMRGFGDRKVDITVVEKIFRPLIEKCNDIVSFIEELNDIDIYPLMTCKVY